MRVLAIDPGGNTGLALWNDGAWWAWAEPAEQALVTVHNALNDGDLNQLVSESFIISTATAKKSQDGLVSIEMIGVMRYLSRVYNVPFETQTPSDAKSFATDEKLKAWKWWTRGVDHPRDASRHLMTWLCKHGYIDLTELRHRLDSASGGAS